MEALEHKPQAVPRGSKTPPKQDGCDLALTIIADAVRCYRHYLSGHPAKDWRELELAWRCRQSPENAWLLAFENSCESFGVDPALFCPDATQMARWWGRPAEC